MTKEQVTDGYNLVARLGTRCDPTRLLLQASLLQNLPCCLPTAELIPRAFFAAASACSFMMTCLRPFYVCVCLMGNAGFRRCTWPRTSQGTTWLRS